MQGKWLLVLALGFSSTAVVAQIASTPPPDKDPFVGTWRANPDKSRPRLKGTDAFYTRTFARDGDDIVSSSERGSGRPVRNNYKVRCDGRFHTVPFGSLSCKYTAPNVVEGESLDLSMEYGYWRREVSDDGQEMRMLAYHDKEKKKLKSIMVLERVR